MVTPLGWAALGIGASVGGGGVFKRFSSTGRRLARKEKRFRKAEYKAKLAGIESDIGFRRLEDPREQLQLKGSLFGRGLGKSTIATQNTARLTDMQARRMAALRRQHDLALKGIDLIKLRAKAARRFLPFDIIDDIAAGFGAWQGVGDSGGDSGDEGGGSSKGTSYEWKAGE